MILKFVFRAEGAALKLPKHYNRLLQAFFYKNMDEQIATFLHDRGYELGKRKFKLFTFSKIFGKFLKKDNEFVYYKPTFRIYFASPKNEVSISTLRKMLLENKDLFLGENKLELLNVEAVVLEEIPEEVEVKTLSPIVVYKTEPGSKFFNYLTPHEEEFYRLLRENLKKKFMLVYGRPFEGEIEIEPVKVSGRDFKKVVFKGTLIKAWEGIYRIKAPKEVLKLAFETGLGAKNSAGFGMVLPAKIRV